MNDDTQTTPRCHNCKWWVGNALVRNLEQAMGECHRFPPQIAGLIKSQSIQGPTTNAVTAFPTVNAMTGCGEHTSTLQVMQ